MKGILTILSVYEIIMIWCLHIVRAEFFQYIVACVFLPVILVLLFIWRKELTIFFKRLWYVITAK